MFVLMLILVTLPQMILASENESQTNITMTQNNVTNDVLIDVNGQITISYNETKALSTTVGAQMRMLQLQKRIDIQIESATTIIVTINELNSSFDTTRLEEITDELKALSEMISNYDFEANNATIVQDYVSMKQESISLSQEFKQITAQSLSDEQKAQLKANVQTQAQKRIKEQNKEIQQLKNKYMLQNAYSVANKLDLDVEAYQEAIKSGNMTYAQVRAEIVTAYNQLSDEDKKNLTAELKEERIKKQIEIREQRALLVKESKQNLKEFKQKNQAQIKTFLQNAKENRQELMKEVKANNKKMLDDMKDLVKENRETIQTIRTNSNKSNSTKEDVTASNSSDKNTSNTQSKEDKE